MPSYSLSNGTNTITVTRDGIVYSISKFSLISMVVAEPILYLYWYDNPRFTNQKIFTIDFNDVVTPAVGSATALQTIINGWLGVIGGAAMGDGNYGDVTVSGSGSVITINNDVVTFAKFQNINTGVLLGRSTGGSGNTEEITIGTGLSLAAGVLSSTATGTVTTVSVASANGFAGTVANATTTPAITLKTTVTGILLGDGTAVAAAADTDITAFTLSGLSVTGTTIVGTDTILEAFGKTQNQINALVGGVNYQGTWNANTNSPTLSTGVGTKGYYYVVATAGSTNLDGITDWKLGDWAIFNGTAWEKVDNTDAVISVNGGTGAVLITVTATLGRTKISGGSGLTPTIDIDPAWIGQTAITTLGTITTGTWNGTAIANANLANSSITINGNVVSLGGSTTVTASPVGTALNSTNIWVGSAGNVAAAVAMSGDATLSNTGALTLANTAVSAAAYTVNGSAHFTVDSKGRLTSASNVSLVLASAQFANQGTATTVLHGNASGNPSWSAVSLTADVSGILPGANGGTGVANTGFTITLAGNLATTGAFNTTLAAGFTGTITLPTATSTLATLALTETFTNKRITKRVQSVADAATITPNADSDDCVDITAIAQAFTIANPSGTPTNMQTLWIRIKDNGTARAITWGSNYVAGGVALPTTTIISKILNLGFVYNTANTLNKWQLIASAQEA